MQLHHAGWHVEAWSRMVAMKLGALRALKLGALRGGDEALRAMTPRAMVAERKPTVAEYRRQYSRQGARFWRSPLLAKRHAHMASDLDFSDAASTAFADVVPQPPAHQGWTVAEYRRHYNTQQGESSGFYVVRSGRFVRRVRCDDRRSYAREDISSASSECPSSDSGSSASSPLHRVVSCVFSNFF